MNFPDIILAGALFTRFSFSRTPNDMDVDIVWSFSQIVSPLYMFIIKIEGHGGDGGVKRKGYAPRVKVVDL